MYDQSVVTETIMNTINTIFSNLFSSIDNIIKPLFIKPFVYRWGRRCARGRIPSTSQGRGIPRRAGRF